MADDDFKEWQRRQRSFQPPPKLPDDVHVSDRVQDLFDNLATQADVLPPGDERDDVLEAMAGIRDKVKTTVAAKEPAFVEDRLNTKTAFTDPHGRLAVRETDTRGRSRVTTNAVLKDGQVTPIDPELAAEAVATQRRWIDEVASIRDDRADANRMAELAGELDDQELRDRVAAIRASANDRLGKLKEEIPHDLWESYEVGRWDPIKAAVAPVVEALQAGRLDEVLTSFNNMTEGERYHFMQQAGDLPHGDQLIEDLTRHLEIEGE